MPRSFSAEPPLPSDREVLDKQAIYADAEPRDLAYKVARELVERAYSGDASFSQTDGVAILLTIWNAGFYRFRPRLMRTLVPDLDRLIASHDGALVHFRARSAGEYDSATDGPVVEQLYRDFVAVLWPVGSAKALHVLAPSFFPIWDQAIARHFHLALSPPAASVASYLRLMDIAARFVRGSRLVDPLKALDEWAFVRFTLRR